MKVWLLFDTYGVAGEEPIFRGAYATEGGARRAGALECYGARRYFSDSTGADRDPAHNCFAGPAYMQCEGTWWDISEVEVAA